MRAFGEQVRFARVWGAAAVAIGLLGALGLKFSVESFGVVPPEALVFIVSGMPLVSGAPLLLLGGLVRPIHRWQWHNQIRHSVLWNGYFQRSITQGWASPFWTRWLHIDSEGNDLDARP